MARYDAGRLSNQSTRSARIYKDLNLDFQQNTATKDIQKLLDVESVKRSVRNLINLNHYEKPFHPEVGSNLRGMLFEANDPLMGHRIKESIVNALSILEPRIGRVAVDIVQRDNSVDVRVAYVIMGSASHQELEFSVSRVR